MPHLKTPLLCSALLACLCPWTLAQEATGQPGTASQAQGDAQKAAATKGQSIVIPKEVAQLGQSARKRASLNDALERAAELESILSKPLIVNGKTLDPLEVQRQTLYLVGQRQMQQKLIEMLIDDQIEEQIRDGRKRSEFDVIENEVKKSIAKIISEFKTKNPGKNFWEELRKTNTSREEYFTMQRSTLLFDKIFFPGIPRNWPEITKECIVAAGGEQGTEFFKKFEESVKEGQPVPPLWLHICRQWVMSKLQDWTEVRYASDGLAPDVCLEVNGRQWKTTEAMKALGLKITPTDRRRALTEIVLQTAMKQQLQAEGHWLSDEEFKKEFAEYSAPYDKTPFTVKVMALNFKGFPNFEIYKQRWRLERSYQRKIAKEVNDENLKKHLEQAKSFLADGRASIRLIRIAAFDDMTGTWKPGGWAQAEQKAKAAMKALEGGMSFDEAVQKFSFWPEHMTNQGSLTNKSLNEIRQELRESEYSDFIAGYSVAEILFYKVAANQVAGPLRGQDGYYLGYVVNKQEPVGSVDLADKNQRDLVKQDYLTHRFLTWSNEIAAKTSIR
ncbi:MAG: hypothetical protein CSA62_13675 [Planctomycetota bacterium]|nr:MAG: hypothetical protein CSA62_13675 [Planctomycetota bacterium]